MNNRLYYALIYENLQLSEYIQTYMCYDVLCQG